MRLHLYYDEDDEIKGSIGFIESRRYVIRSMVPEGYEAYFQEQALYINVHSSTAIEGNPLSQEQSMQVLMEGAHAEEPNEVEKVNLQEAYELIAPLASDASVAIDQGMIRTLHSVILKGLPDPKARNRGKYRVGPSTVIDRDTRQIRYLAPPPEWVAQLMEAFVEDLRRWIEEYPGPIAAALAHFALVSIHPFDDGNGRTARLIADIVLTKTGWSVEGMLSVNQALLERHADYYAALRDAQGETFSEEVNVTPFINFHMHALSFAAGMLEDKVVSFNRRRDGLLRVADGALNPRQITGLMAMLDIGPISSSQYARMTESSQSSALADLLEMTKVGVALKTGAGRSTRYTLSPELRERAPTGTSHSGDNGEKQETEDGHRAL